MTSIASCATAYDKAYAVLSAYGVMSPYLEPMTALMGRQLETSVTQAALTVITDIGDDPDDEGAMRIYAILRGPFREFFGMARIESIITTLFKPNVKAVHANALVMSLSDSCHIEPISVFAGIGAITEGAYRDRYKLFPKKFVMFTEQERIWGGSDLSFDEGAIAIDDLIRRAHASETKLHLVGIAAISTLYEALKKDPTIAEKIKLTMMGGWKEKAGKLRVGYNCLMDLEAFDGVVNGYKIETLIVNSLQFVIDSALIMTRRELTLLHAIADSLSGSLLTLQQNSGMLMMNCLRYYTKHSEAALAYTDPITLLIALFPEFAESRMMKLSFFDLEKIEGDYLTANAETFFKAEAVDESNISVVHTIKYREGLAQLLSGSMFKLLLPPMTILNEIFWTDVHSDMPVEAFILKYTKESFK